MPEYLEVPIPFPLRHQKTQRHNHRHALRHNDGTPDSVQPKDQRQNENARALKHQSTEERDHCGNKTISQRREKAEPKMEKPQNKNEIA